MMAFAVYLIAILTAATSLRADNAKVIATAAGDYHSLYLTSDGKLWATGNNQYGQLGDGTTTNRDTPVNVASDVIAIAAGSYHSLYITKDGKLWAMGYNIPDPSGNNTTTTSDGATNDDSVTYQATPVQVASDVVSVTAGGFHSLFVTDDGSLWAMGDNTEGQLGTNAVAEESKAPVLVFDAAAPAGAPVITKQPVDQNVTATTNVTASVSFTVAATGAYPVSYQWQINQAGTSNPVWGNCANAGTSMSGADTPTLTLSMLGGSLVGFDQTQFRCVAQSLVAYSGTTFPDSTGITYVDAYNVSHYSSGTVMAVAASNPATLHVNSTSGGSGNSGGGGGGGGGAPSLWWLGAVAAMLALRRMTNRKASA